MRSVENIYRARSNFSRKQSEAYRNYDYSFARSRHTRYIGKGYLVDLRTLADGNLGPVSNVIWEEKNIRHKNLKFYEEALKLCNKKGTQVIIIDITTPFANMASQRGYAEYEEYVQDFAAKHNVSFFNFGYLKTEVLDRKDSYFYDRIHMSQTGGDVFSHIFADFLNQYLQGTLQESDWFYSSYDEMMAENPIIFNTWLTEDNNSKTIIANAYYGSGVTPEYQFLYKQMGTDEYKIIQEYSDNTVLSLKDIKNGFVRVNCRVAGSDYEWEQWDERKIN
jgi:hypothetical protein